MSSRNPSNGWGFPTGSCTGATKLYTHRTKIHKLKIRRPKFPDIEDDLKLTAEELNSVMNRIMEADSPAKEFNKLKGVEKKSVVEDLLMAYWQLSQTPEADRAIVRDVPLFEASESDREYGMFEDDEEDEEPSPRRSARQAALIHGKKRWPEPPKVEGVCERPVFLNDQYRVEMNHDPYCLRTHFISRWAVLMDGNEPDFLRYDLRPTKPITWSDRDLCLEAMGNGRPALRWIKETYEERGHHYEVRTTCLAELISSPLMQYRLMAIFAAPPSFDDNDGYKTTWSYTLWNVEDPRSKLNFREHKGWVNAHFIGTTKTSNEALQLLEWLSGTNCPHMYDYTPCGASA